MKLTHVRATGRGRKIKKGPHGGLYAQATVYLEFDGEKRDLLERKFGLSALLRTIVTCYVLPATMH